MNEEGLGNCPPNRAVYATRNMVEEGYLSQMDYTSVVKEGELYTILWGDIVAVGFDPETGMDRDLTDAEIAQVETTSPRSPRRQRPRRSPRHPAGTPQGGTCAGAWREPQG